MKKRKSGRPVIVLLLSIVFITFCGSLVAIYHFNGELEAYQRFLADADISFQSYSPQHFRNSAADAEPYISYDHRDDALYFFEAPEGFTMVSHSTAWNREMLEFLYHELMQNEHGEEINLLYEVVVYPYEEEEGSVLASYTLGTTALSFFIQFPALPPDFTIDFPEDFGRINLYGGDTKTTIESMAESLSHEYGHLYTFYYLFSPIINEHDSNDYISLEETLYAELREAKRYDLITSASPGESYMQERHRYLVEVAAEDYIQLMGSPTTRRVVDFVDVQQVVNGAEQPQSIAGARNAFPQENMMLPLASEVPGLGSYFFSFINAGPRVPAEERKHIALQISQNSIQHNLVSGLRTFVHYEIAWNAPYQDAIYTLICYDPDNYTGWGFPIKTVHPGQTTSAVIGEYVVEQGNQVVSLDDGHAHGVKVFLVVAALPDGTYYTSDRLEYQF